MANHSGFLPGESHGQRILAGNSQSTGSQRVGKDLPTKQQQKERVHMPGNRAGRERKYSSHYFSLLEQGRLRKRSFAPLAGESQEAIC